MSDDKSIERVKRISVGEITRMTYTAQQLREDGHDDLAEEYEREVRGPIAHQDYVSRLSERMKFGSVGPRHTERVMDWLIETGWTPPDHILLNDTEETPDA